MMAYAFYNPSDNYYPNLLGASSSPCGYARDFGSRSDPYLRALADEQLARRHLASAVRHEQEARRIREIAQAQAQARARAEVLARRRAAQEQEEARRRAYAQATRADPQTVHGVPFRFLAEALSDQEEKGARDDGGEQWSNLAERVLASGTSCRSRSAPHACGRSESQAGSSMRPHCDAEVDVRSDGKKWSVQLNEVTTTKVPITSLPEPIEDVGNVNRAAAKIQSAYRAHAERVAASKARTSALEKVYGISSKLDALRSSYVIPSTLDFDTSRVVKPRTTLTATEDDDVLPPYRLAYSANNASIHGYLAGLLDLLQDLDAVESGGNGQVRQERKEVVKAVEAEMARVDSEVAKVWAESERGQTQDAPESFGYKFAEASPVKEVPSSEAEKQVDEVLSDVGADGGVVDEEAIVAQLFVDAEEDAMDEQPSLDASMEELAFSGEKELNNSRAAVSEAQEDTSHLMIDVESRIPAVEEAEDDGEKMVDVEAARNLGSTLQHVVEVDEDVSTSAEHDDDDGVLVGLPILGVGLDSQTEHGASEHGHDSDFEML